MGPRRDSHENAAERQLADSNNALNVFLGGLSRQPSWLTGAAGPSSPRRPTQASTHQTPPRRREADMGRSVDLRDVSSTSASPTVPNIVPVTPRQPSLSSMSPPHTPAIATTATPTTAPSRQTEVPIGSSASAGPDKTRKRKEMDVDRQWTQPKRVQVGSPAGSPSNSHSPNQGGSPNASNAQNVHQRQAPASSLSSMPSNPPMQDGRRFSSPTLMQNGRQRAPGAEVPHHAGCVVSPQANGQRIRVLQNNAPHVGPQSPMNYQYVAAIQQHPFILLTAGSPIAPIVTQQYLRLISQATEPSSSLQTPQNSRHEPARQPQPQTQAPPPPPPPLPILEPYISRNCTRNMEGYLRRRQANGLPPLGGFENSRLELLTQAARENDSLFLFIHQMISKCAISLDTIPHIFRNAPRFVETLTILNNLFGGSVVKDTGLLGFFGQLPCSLSYTALEYPDTYKDLLNYMRALSMVLPDGWESLKKSCERRGYPPLATELWNLKIFSPNLMNTFFQAALRQVWPATDPNYLPSLHKAAKQLFEENKQALYAAARSYNLPQDTTQHLATIYHHKFEVLKQQMEQHQNRHRQAAIAPHSSLSAGANPQQQINRQPPLAQAPLLQFQPLQGTQQFRNQQPTIPRHAIPPSSISIAPSQHSGLSISPMGISRPDQIVTPTWQLPGFLHPHLQDPRFSDDLAQRPESELLYQYIHSFAVEPKRLSPGKLYHVFTFALPAEDSVAQTTHTNDGQRKLRKLDESSHQYRLRMIKAGNSPNEHEDLRQNWVLKATSFDINFYFELNGQMLEIRRKWHYTKDLPVDITEFVKPGSENTLEIWINLASDDVAISQYACAIEVVGAKSHNSILEECQRRTIPRDISLKAITDRLNRTASVDDNDDIIIDNAKTNITIYDPIGQNQICSLPARGTDCKHADCFDLLTFLQSRPREKPHWPSDVDSWRCPICLADVRPQHIVIDGFLKEVREKLIGEDKRKVRTITVKSDGSWRPKIEEEVPSEQSTPEASEPVPPTEPLVDSAGFDGNYLPRGFDVTTALAEALRGALSTATGMEVQPTSSAPARTRKRVIIDLSKTG